MTTPYEGWDSQQQEMSVGARKKRNWASQSDEYNFSPRIVFEVLEVRPVVSVPSPSSSSVRPSPRRCRPLFVRPVFRSVVVRPLSIRPVSCPLSSVPSTIETHSTFQKVMNSKINFSFVSCENTLQRITPN